MIYVVSKKLSYAYLDLGISPTSGISTLSGDRLLRHHRAIPSAFLDKYDNELEVKL